MMPASVNYLTFLAFPHSGEGNGHRIRFWDWG